MIHEQANINPNATIGDGVHIDAFTTIYDDVVIGDGTTIGPNVTIYPGSRIGKNVQIFPGAVIGAIPQDLKFNGEYSTTEIGDNTVIRECVTIHRGTADRETTRVGKNCLLMCYVHVAHDCLIGDNVVIANSSGIAGHCVIGDWVVIEGMCGFQQFIQVGEHAFVAGMSQVRKDIPPYVRVAREPLTFAGINAIGLRRRGMTDEKVKLIEDIYRNLFILNNSVSVGLKTIEQEIEDCDEKKLVIDFINQSDKGIIKGPL